MSEETKYELVKFIDDELELEVSVSPKEETIWMTQEGIALLFGKSKSTINIPIIFIPNLLQISIVFILLSIFIYSLSSIISFVKG